MTTKPQTSHATLRPAPLAVALCGLLGVGAAGANGNPAGGVVPTSADKPQFLEQHRISSDSPLLAFARNGTTSGFLRRAGRGSKIEHAIAEPAKDMLHSSITVSNGAVEEREEDRRRITHRQQGNRPERTPSSVESRGSYAFRVVTNCNDSGPGSLREAIEESPGQTTLVEFDNQLSCSTITLTSGAIHATMSTLTIRGSGPPPFGDITIVADFSDTDRNRIIKHTGSGTLDISRVSMTGGSYSQFTGHTTAAGGCIYSLGKVDLGQMSLSGCSVSGDWIVEGGAVFAYEGVRLSASHVSNSSAIGTNGSFISVLGGGVMTNGSLRAVGGSVIDDNFAINATNKYKAQGGGASVSGLVTLEGSTVHNNYTTGRGGGLLIQGELNSSSHSIISQSTVSANQAGKGGGIYFADQLSEFNALDIVNSTISGNHATGVVGGVFVNSRTLNLSNSTIAFNAAANRELDGNPFVFAGLHMDNAFGAIQSSIIANNVASGLPADFSTTDDQFLSGADNLIVVGTHGVGTVSSDDPLLLPLRNNGGRTRTHALATDSPAIDAGNNALSLSEDQRGVGDFDRVVGPATDIGAFEKQGPFDGDRIFANGFD